MKRIAVIGAGFSGLSAACYLSKDGYEVDVYEKNESTGGRARQFLTPQGYLFDMGPSWYWMPDIFESFFNDFGFSCADFYTLDLLNPSFEVVFPEGVKMLVPASFEALGDLFEEVEPGAKERLVSFMKDARTKYEIATRKFMYNPGLSVFEFMDLDILRGSLKLNLLSSFASHVRKYFKNPKLIALMEFPVLFLGAMPDQTPALYSMMNYAGYECGTWYPQGGFGEITNAMEFIAEKQNVQFQTNSPVEKIITANQLATGIVVNGTEIKYDAVVASADYHFVEQQLLEERDRNYDKRFWEKRTLAPSCLIFYIGLNKKINNLQHHTLFFEENLSEHAAEIYKNPSWPTNPLFYLCCPSKTDDTVAPAGHENLFFLMPLAPGIEDTNELREKYFAIMIKRLENHIGLDIRPFIDFKKSYCIKDFESDYHSFKGNAYGLANTFFQTANLRPRMQNRKNPNLFYCGQMAVPGPGVPPALVSGKIAATQLHKYFKQQKHEAAI